MDLYFRRHDQFLQRYNCSFYNAEVYPREERTSINAGILFLVSGFIEEILYIPVVYVILDKNLLQTLCYRIMLIMALLDMVILPGSAFATSYFLMKGTVYCDHPIMIYFIGLWLLALWMGYALYAVILALNRCASFTSFDIYFKGKWEYFWLILPWFMILYHFLYGTPVIFNPQHYGWFFNPHMGYFEDDDRTYFNWAHTVENVVVATAIPLLYVAFYFYVRNIGRGRTNDVSNNDKNLFGQIFVMSLIISAAGLTYFVMQLSFMPYWVKCTGHYGWIIVQGCPPVIYLKSNRTFQKKLFGKRSRGIGNSSTTKPP